MSVGGVRGFLEALKVACDSPSISLMALLSQFPGVCVPATCYMLYGSEMEEQAVQTRRNRRRFRRLTALRGGPALSVLYTEKMSDHPQLRG